MKQVISKVFVAVSVLGIAEAIYHAWSEKAFVTNIFLIHYSAFASFFGIPYWVFGIVWFPLIFLVGLWTTSFGRVKLNKELLLLLTVGNIFTAYLWYLDMEVVKAYNPLYVALYATNYALTAMIVVQNWSSDIMHGYAYGTITGAVVGLLFGPYGVAACGIFGGVFGAIRNYVFPKKPLPSGRDEAEREYLEEEKVALETKLREIEDRLEKESS